MSFLAKAIMPVASSIFRKVAPAGINAIRSFFSKAPSLKSITSGLGKVSDFGNKVVNNPYADILASQLGAGKSLNFARDGLKGIDKVQSVTNEASNILEKVKAVQPMKKQIAEGVTPSSRMPVAFNPELRGYSGGRYI